MDSKIILGVRFQGGSKIYEYLLNPKETYVPSNLAFLFKVAMEEEELMNRAFDANGEIDVWIDRALDGPAHLEYVVFTDSFGGLGVRDSVRAVGSLSEEYSDGLEETELFQKILKESISIKVSRKEGQINKTKTEREYVDMKTPMTKSNDNGMFNNIGKKITGVFGMSMMGGQPAVKLGSKWVVYDKNSEILHDVSDFVVELDMFPGIAMPVPISNLVEGDLVIVNEELGFVVSTKKGKFDIITGDGEVKTIMGLTHFLMGQSAFAVKVMNPMSGMGMQGGQGDLGFNPMMLMLMGKDNGSDSNSMLESMMMMNMMSGQGGMFGAPMQSQEGVENKKD